MPSAVGFAVHYFMALLVDFPAEVHACVNQDLSGFLFSWHGEINTY